MIYGIYSIKDAKTSFMPANIDVNDDSAIRNFEHAVNRTDSILSSHPNDFALYRIGLFNDVDGEVVSDFKQLVDAAQILKRKE